MPALVIVTPDGTVLARKFGLASRKVYEEWLEEEFRRYRPRAASPSSPWGTPSRWSGRSASGAAPSNAGPSRRVHRPPAPGTLWDRSSASLPPEAKRLYVAPDGDVALVPFEAIRGEDGRYLVEPTASPTSRTARDLVPRPRPPGDPGPAVLVAAPDYDPRLPGTPPSPRSRRPPPTSLRSLPGSGVARPGSRGSRRRPRPTTGPRRPVRRPGRSPGSEVPRAALRVAPRLRGRGADRGGRLAGGPPGGDLRLLRGRAATEEPLQAGSAARGCSTS